MYGNAVYMQHSLFARHTAHCEAVEYGEKRIAKQSFGMQNRVMMSTMHNVKVYTASSACMEDERLFEAWLERVPQARRQKAVKPKNPKVRFESLAAGALLTVALADCAAGADDLPSGAAGLLKPDKVSDLRILENEHGRPYLPDLPDLHFSLSHSGDRVMCAVSGAPVGCDVEEAEETEADRRRIRYVARCLTESERELALADPSAFYRIWTLKESFVKMTGRGLAIPLSSFEITLDPVSIRQDIVSTHIELKEFGRTDGYQYACVSQTCPVAIFTVYSSHSPACVYPMP